MRVHSLHTLCSYIVQTKAGGAWSGVLFHSALELFFLTYITDGRYSATSEVEKLCIGIFVFFSPNIVTRKFGK